MYRITYLDEQYRKKTEEMKDTVEFYQRIRRNKLTVIRVERVS